MTRRTDDDEPLLPYAAPEPGTGAPPDGPRERRRRRHLGWASLMATVVALMGIVAWYLTGPHTLAASSRPAVATSSASAPPSAWSAPPGGSTGTIARAEIVGRSQNEASALLHRKGFTMIRAISVASTQPRGTVVDVDREGTAPVTAPVTLSVSTGPTSTAPCTPGVGAQPAVCPS